MEKGGPLPTDDLMGQDSDQNKLDFDQFDDKKSF